MKKMLGWVVLSAALWGCQSDSGRMDASQGNTKVSVSVSNPQATPPPGEGVPVVSTPIASAGSATPDSTKITLSNDGVNVQSSHGSEVKVDQGGVEISSVANDGKKLVIQGVGDKKTYKCDKQPVEINGTGHDLKLTGTVTRLEVNGANNQIEVEQAEKVDVNGSGNKVFYRGSKPEIELNGLNNDCQPR